MSEAIDAIRILPTEGRPEWLMMLRIDRIGRGQNIIETQLVVHELRELGVKIWTREEGEIKAETAMEQMLVAIKATVAAQENAVRRDKAANVYKRKRAAGQAVGNKRPFGLEIGPDGKDRPLKSHVSTIREAFKMRAAGVGYHSIAQRLAEIAPPHTFKNGRTQTVRWTQGRVLRLLQNPAYSGTVVDATLFSRVQRVGEQLGQVHNDPTKRHPWPLSGAIRCYCGRAMIGLMSGAKGRRLRYYGCRAIWVHGKTRSVRADELETQFVTLLERLKASPALADRWRKRTVGNTSPRLIERGIRETKARIADCDRRRDLVWAMAESGKVRQDDVQQRLDVIADRRAEATASLTQLESERAVVQVVAKRDRDAEEIFRSAPAIFAKASIEAKKKIARAVAVTLGGLHLAEDGKIKRGTPEDPERQRKRSSSGK